MYQNQKWMSTFELIFQWVTRMAYINFFCGSFFLVLGLVFLGVFPSTIATLSIVRKWLNGQDDFSIWKSFKAVYKQNFVKGNLVGWLFITVGSILYLNYEVLKAMEESIFVFSLFAFILLVFFYFALFIWIFPLMIHYESHLLQHLKNAFIIGVGNIHKSTYILLWMFVIGYLSLEFPSMILFFSISLFILGWGWITLNVLKKIDTNVGKGL